ncbi:MAG TPA: hypothetical protein VEJ18_00995, partial [Planctomycetota bacterium]|nr:hypothetical protein [Planctomycetota bacterium]
MWSVVAAAFLASAQVPEPECEPNEAAELERAVQEAQGGAGPGKPAEAKPEDKRLQKLLQLRFDRRPSAMLAALAGPSAKAPAEKEPKDGAKKEPPDPEVAAFQRAVTVGDWTAVRSFLAGLPADHGKKAYDHLLNGLSGAQGNRFGPQMMPGMVAEDGGEADEEMMAANQMQAALMRAQMAQQQMMMEAPLFLPEDVLGLADASPAPLAKDAVKKLGSLLQQALSKTNVLGPLLQRLEEGTARLGGKEAERRKAAAQLLVASGQVAEAGRFLPTLEEAEARKDAEALNLLARHAVAHYQKVRTTESLERAWTLARAALAVDAPGEAEEALERALDVASRVRKELGAAWLDSGFTAEPARGIRILATIGRIIAANPRERSAETRLRRLELQHHAMEALLRTSPDRATEWRRTLDLLALNWLREADYSRQMDASANRDPMMAYDRFGNVYYQDFMHPQMMNRNPNMIEAIGTGRLLDAAPGEAWRARLDPSLGPKLVATLAHLHLKVNEAEKAFPYVEALASTHREEALVLANEFLEVWTRNHDPNRDRRRTNPYMYIYGYNPRAAGIPLTRSKQARNLQELSVWVKRLRALNIGDLDERRLSAAFVASHSTAEVYRIEDLEAVFGATGGLKPETLAELVQTMRGNLAGVWRSPKLQEEKKTNRKDKDIQAEVFRGYAVAREAVARGLSAHPDHWALELAGAAIQLDEAMYRHSLEASAEFAARRGEALARFARAADLYAKAVPGLEETRESSQVYEMWFYAGLGACDLQSISHQQPPDSRQPELIRRAILGLPGPAAERHLARFANALSTRLANAQPEIKHRYLKAGLAVVGDHPQAREARKLFDYYADLVTEIRLVARVDGPTAVGHGRPFGVFLDIRHTKEIERESGGFQKYLTNQNQNPYAFNFGRPPADYRDKFEEAARAALEEHFEVLSVTFHSEKMESRGDPEPGWRVTPYAYLLLKARGKEVDEVPSLKLDLDFLDTSGYVVLPVESPRIPVDASRAEPRPVERIEIVQTLDERKSAEGKLVVEVKATARGLVPEFGEMLDAAGGEFRVVRTEDPGLAVARMDAEGDAV